MSGRFLLLLLVPLIAANRLFAQAAPPANDAQNDSTVAGKPLAAWHFDSAEELGQWRGKAEFGPGPRPPSYPGFAADNRAAHVGTGRFVVLADGGKRPELRQGGGDSLTLEAWVRVERLGDGQYAYIVGKGRTRAKGRPELNQNYALRLTGREKSVSVSFLFASAPEAEKPADWHRWTTAAGFAPDNAWHHVAVTYTFGKPESIRGYVDGQSLPGTWDMGGATTRPPVADDDDLWVGAGNGGGDGNVFHGWLDDVAIWGETLSEKTLAARYQAVAPASRGPLVERAKLPPGKVLVEICESGVPEANAWPVESPPATESFLEEAFGFFEMPHKYVASGVRGDRPIPYLVRAAGVVSLPAGKHRLLLRGRGASRLWIDGRLVLTTPFPPPGTDGHNPIPKEYLDLGPDFRFAPPGNRERWTAWETKGGEHLIVLETLVGSMTGKQKRRPELGETVAAISLENHEGFTLLAPGSRLWVYNDAGWAAYQAERRTALDRLNAQRRARCREEHADYWNKRRTAAEKWLASTEETPVPPLPPGFPANNAIDHFLSARIATARQAAHETKPGEVDFHYQIRPLLAARCLDCHRGPKAKAGLSLESRESALKGGESGDPAFVASRPAKSELIRRISSHDAGERMPPRGDPLTEGEIALVSRWIQEGAVWPEFPPEPLTLPPLADDLTFLRRVTLDTVGVLPSLAEIRDFQADPRSDKRARTIVGSSRVDLQACKLEYSIVSPK